MITATVVIVVSMVVSMISTIIISMFVTAIIPAVVMLFLITRSVFSVVPVVAHKVDPLAAGIVFVTVLSPILTVARRYAQIDRFTFYLYALNYSRLSIDYLWLRIATDVESAIKAWLPDTDRNSNIGSEHRGSDSDSSYCHCD
jgi:hypothetical protein